MVEDFPENYNGLFLQFNEARRGRGCLTRRGSTGSPAP
jgi:hypothetical protein